MGIGNSNSIKPHEQPSTNNSYLDISGTHKATVHAIQSPTASKIDSISTEIILHQKFEADAATTLKSNTPKPPEASEIANRIKLNPKLEGLTKAQQQKVVDECLNAYSESVAVFEDVIGEISYNHPDAKEFAKEFVQRVYQVAEAYQEILIEDNPESHLLSPLMQELKIKLGASSKLSQEPSVSGSVGSNPQAIQNAIKNGELRELLALVYVNLRFVLPVVLENPALVDRVNVKLHEKAGFQLNSEAINKKKEEAKSGSSSMATFFPQAQGLVDFRKGGRIDNKNPRQTTQVKDIKDLTYREYLATVGYNITEAQFQAMKNGETQGKKHGEHNVQWVSGGDLFEVEKNSDFYKQSIALGKLPVVTGPSGTSDQYLNGMNYLNMNEYKDKAILAFTGWMTQSRDHSFHEIKVAGSWHGMEYNPGPETFENVYPDDPNFQNEIQSSMRQQGKELPGEYLKDDYQLKVAKKLGFIG